MRIIVTILLVCIVPAVRGADEENPFKNAKVGDWVEYKIIGSAVEGKTKMTILAKDDKAATYEVTTSISFMGKESTGPAQTKKIDLTKSYDAISAANLNKDAVKIEKQGNGMEKLKIGDKEYDTTWTKLKATSTGKIVMEMDYKMWFSKDVPLSGMVKMETTWPGTTVKLEMIGSGRK